MLVSSSCSFCSARSASMSGSLKCCMWKGGSSGLLQALVDCWKVINYVGRARAWRCEHVGCGFNSRSGDLTLSFPRSGNKKKAISGATQHSRSRKFRKVRKLKQLLSIYYTCPRQMHFTIQRDFFQFESVVPEIRVFNQINSSPL